MAKSTIKSINFTSDYEEELKYFESQNNSSKYVCELIRKDMVDDTSLESLRRDVDELKALLTGASQIPRAEPKNKPNNSVGKEKLKSLLFD